MTDDNKHEYVRLYVASKLTHVHGTSITSQIAQLREGLFDIIQPEKMRALFSHQEMEMLLCGVSEIDPTEWERHCTYSPPYHAGCHCVRWIWQAVASFSLEERCRLLHFVTSTSRLPSGGFEEIVPCFKIKRGCDPNALPTAATCFNTLTVPEYDSYDELRSKLWKAFMFGHHTFGSY